MGITDELREYVNQTPVPKSRVLMEARERFNAIADRIDEAHKHAIGYVDDRDPETMAENGWVRLPKDADGVPIHVGDVLTDGECIFKVFELAAFEDGSWRIHNVNGNSWEACDVTHYHEPTVKDVLREVVTLCHNTWKKESAFHFYDVDDVMESGNIAEYADKLRLAGEK